MSRVSSVVFHAQWTRLEYVYETMNTSRVQETRCSDSNAPLSLCALCAKRSRIRDLIVNPD